MKVPEDPNLDPILVRELSVGDHFGELALINDAKRSLSVKVKSSDCKVMCLNRSAFDRILGDINKYLKKNYNGEFDNAYQKNS